MERSLRFLMLNWRDPENPASGGAERVSLAYLAALADRGHQVWWHAHAFKNAPEEALLEGVHIRRAGNMISSILKVRQWLHRQPAFDLVIDQHHGIPWFAPWWCKTRCVAYIHEVLGPIWSSFYPAPLALLGQFQENLTHRLYRNIPFWTACSETASMLHERGVVQIKQIPYGVHTEVLSSLPEKTIQEPVRLVTVSRLAPNKRVEDAIDTVACLKELGLQASLTIIGSGGEASKLKSRIRQSPCASDIRLAGALSESEKDMALTQAHCLLHTSVREGWGLNVIEANAMGTPAVVYPVPGLTESTLHGATGRVSKEETPRALAEEILHFAQHPEDYQRCRVLAWKRAREFHWNRILPKACDWLESMALGDGDRS